MAVALDLFEILEIWILLPFLLIIDVGARASEGTEALVAFDETDEFVAGVVDVELLWFDGAEELDESLAVEFDV